MGLSEGVDKRLAAYLSATKEFLPSLENPRCRKKFTRSRDDNLHFRPRSRSVTHHEDDLEGYSARADESGVSRYCA